MNTSDSTVDKERIDQLALCVLYARCIFFVQNTSSILRITRILLYGQLTRLKSSGRWEILTKHK